MHRASAEPKLWFRAKRYGWGWTPCSWQGWVSVGLFVLAVYGVTWWFFDTNKDTVIKPLSWLIYAASIIVLILLLIWLAKSKGEKPHWRWGSRNK